MLSTKWSQRGEEPKLNELMSDPMVELIMARDNLEVNDVWKVVEKAKEQIDKKAA